MHIKNRDYQKRSIVMNVPALSISRRFFRGSSHGYVSSFKLYLANANHYHYYENTFIVIGDAP
jgi:hypothetical protein